MTTDPEKKDRGENRAEATFEALASTSTPAAKPEQGNPWKPAALLLLLMALALPLAFGIRSSRVRIEFEGRVAEAAVRVAEVKRLADAGDLTAAVNGLAEVTAALADVDHLSAATRAVQEVIERKVTDLDAEHDRVAERDLRIDRCRRAVDALLAGDPQDASRLISAGKNLGSLEENLERLSVRLDALCVAAAVEGEARVSALELLASAWKLPAVEAERVRAGEQVRRDREAAKHLKAAKAAWARGENDQVRESLDLACRAKGIDGVRERFRTLQESDFLATGRNLAEAGDHSGAATCFTLAGRSSLAEVERSRFRGEIEAGRRKYLIDQLEVRLQAAPNHRTQAALAWMLGAITGDKGRRQEAVRHSAEDLLASAREFRRQGEPEAALALAEAVKALGSDGADSLKASIVAELARNEASLRQKQAESVLAMGGPAYAAQLLARNPRQPGDLLRRIRVAQRDQAVTAARALFDQGDLSGAGDALTGLPADDSAVRELSLRLILATHEGDFVVEMPKDKDAAEALLYRAVLHRFRTDPAAAGLMLATHDDSPATIVPALAAFLDAADPADDRPLWSAIQKEARKRLAPPTEEVEDGAPPAFASLTTGRASAGSRAP